jgi:hypothetical protein
LLTVGDKAKSCHSLFFGTDDINTLKKKTDVSVGDDPEKPSDEPSFDAEKAREVKDIHDLAKSIFHVYFTNHESDGDAEHMKRQSHMKVPGLLNKINGTMPWLPSYLKDSAAIPAIAKTILFMEACFRGIAQASATLVLENKLTLHSTYLCNFLMISKHRSSSKIIP